MFLHYEKEEFQSQLEDFNNKQRKFCEENNIKLRKKDYLHSKYLQHLTLLYLKDSKTNEDMFSHAIDILIRHLMTHGSFIRYPDDIKLEFYSNAMYRIFNYALKTFKPKHSAFVYFTSAINNAFKEVLNTDNKQREKEKRLFQGDGLDLVISNLENKDITDFEQDLEIEGKIQDNINHPPFIVDLFKIYKVQENLRILENPDMPRFKRVYTEFKYYIPVTKDKFVIVEYIDLLTNNEDSGTSKMYLQNRNLIARKEGHQVFQLFSDVYNDEDIDDKIIFKKLDTMIQAIKNEDVSKTGDSLMLDYIPYGYIESLGVEEPNWWFLGKDRDKRSIVFSQSVEEYMRLKELDVECTRVYDVGVLKVK